MLHAVSANRRTWTSVSFHRTPERLTGILRCAAVSHGQGWPIGAARRLVQPLDSKDGRERSRAALESLCRLCWPWTQSMVVSTVRRGQDRRASVLAIQCQDKRLKAAMVSLDMSMSTIFELQWENRLTENCHPQ